MAFLMAILKDVPVWSAQANSRYAGLLKRISSTQVQPISQGIVDVDSHGHKRGSGPDVATPARRLRTRASLPGARSRLAALTWLSEVLTLILTLVYCGIVAYDRARGEPRLTSASWFSEGFCVWTGETKILDRQLSSHSACFVLDVIAGAWLTAQNYRLARRWRTDALQLAVFVSFFTVLHGMGHLLVGHILPADFQSAFDRPTDYPGLRFAAYFTAVWSFLSMGPYVGYLHGVNVSLCYLIHLVTTLGFIYFVPIQLAFTVVQLLLNLWICTPRVLWLTSFKQDTVIASRIDHGGAIISFGLLLLMPVVFFEMLACDSYAAALGGHILYDGSVVLFALVYSACLWSQCSSSSLEQEE